MIVGNVHHCEDTRPSASRFPVETVWSCDFCGTLWVVSRLNNGYTQSELTEIQRLSYQVVYGQVKGHQDEKTWRWWRRDAARAHNQQLREEQKAAYETRKAAIDAAVEERDTEHTWILLDPQDKPVEPKDKEPLRRV